MKNHRLRKYSGQVQKMRTPWSNSKSNPKNGFDGTADPIHDLFVRVLQEYATAASAHARLSSELVRYDDWCTQNACRETLLFWMCVERYQNREWKPVATLEGNPLPMQTEAVEIFNEFIQERAEYRICITQDEASTLEAALATPTRDMYRSLQSSVFRDMLRTSFAAFWDANPSLATKLAPSSDATVGNVVMACNVFLQEYYDFALEHVSLAESHSTESEASTTLYQRLRRGVLAMCTPLESPRLDYTV